MTTETNGAASGLTLLRKPFPPNQISKLPKPTKQQTEEVKADFQNGIRCALCQSWHHPKVVHLDYVGHAALTDRLLDADPAWTWEPLSMNPDGLPVMDNLGGMWIRLIVCGVSRLGYGHAGNKEGGDAIKEVIGDALRNAAMRFGAALDLWHKGDLHADENPDPVDQPKNFGLSSARAKVVRAAANEALQMFNEGNEFGAYEAVSWIDDNTEKDALWRVLEPHSALRSSLKRSAAEERARQAEIDAKRTGSLEPLLAASIQNIKEAKAAA